jgi:wyosine [tRNA(Phe)-imidazoG37] synthetase (radical SAM superfamily)
VGEFTSGESIKQKQGKVIAFGPIPSRRLGYSIGINHIPPKHCTYACVYCQVGRTSHLQVSRRAFYPVSQIIDEVGKKIAESDSINHPIDYLTLVPDGEPTLDINLAELIAELKVYRLPIAVISNASLIDREDVQDGLLFADWVSLKVDAIGEDDWRKINRPHHHLSLPSILKNILKFRNRFHGELVTETMLVADVNDSDEAIQKLASFLLKLQPFKSYLSIPTRPPSETWVHPPDPSTLQKILTVLSDELSFIDVLFEAEALDFISTGIISEDILGITAVHPLREEALKDMLRRSGKDWSVVDQLIASNKLICIHYRDERFYMRCAPGRDSS